MSALSRVAPFGHQQTLAGRLRNLLRGDAPGRVHRLPGEDRRWNELRRSLAQVGIQLPKYPKDGTDLERLVGCSAKRGQGKPIGIGFETLVKLGHHVHKVWPNALWF